MFFELKLKPELKQWLVGIKPSVLSRAPGQIAIMDRLDPQGRGMAVALPISLSVTVAFTWSNKKPVGISQGFSDGGVLIASETFGEAIVTDWPTLHTHRLSHMQGGSSRRERSDLSLSRKWGRLPFLSMIETLIADDRPFFVTPGKWLIIYVRSNLPVGLGLSSSVAFLTAMVGGFSKAIDFFLPKHQLAQIVGKIEKVKMTAKPVSSHSLTALFGKPSQLLKLEYFGHQVRDFDFICPSPHFHEYYLVLLSPQFHVHQQVQRMKMREALFSCSLSFKGAKAMMDAFCHSLCIGDFPLADRLMQESSAVLDKQSHCFLFRELREIIVRFRLEAKARFSIMGGCIAYGVSRPTFFQFVHKSYIDRFLREIRLSRSLSFWNGNERLQSFVLQIGRGLSVLQKFPGFSATCGDVEDFSRTL